MWSAEGNLPITSVFVIDQYIEVATVYIKKNNISQPLTLLVIVSIMLSRLATEINYIL